MSSTNAFVLLLLSMSLLGGSCCKKEPDPVDRPIPAEMKAYWDFKVGSWWAYQDSTTGVIDTVKVIEYKNYRFDGTLNYTNGPAHCEYLEIITYNAVDQYYNDYWINTSFGGSAYPDYNVVFRSKYGGPIIGSTNCFVYPFKIGNKTYDSNGFYDDTIVVKNVYDTLWNYGDVVQINQNYNMVDGAQHTKLFVAKNIGIIKQVLVDSMKTHSLIDYHIEQ